MPKSTLTDEAVELEIARIRETDAYKLAVAEKHFKYRRRQVLYQCRWMEKRGNELMKLGYTEDTFNKLDSFDIYADPESEVS